MSIWLSVITFIVVLTILVFVHEMGHYLVARWRGVRVEVFSVGFGREVMGWTDSLGTRWKLSWIPFGGYVKFFGDAGVASDQAQEREFSPAEMAVSFHHKSVASRAAVVVAGPLANFAFAVLVLAGLYVTVGQTFSPPVITGVEPDSAAKNAGFEVGDRFLEINNFGIDRFEDVRQLVLANPGQELKFLVERSGENLVLVGRSGTRILTDRCDREFEVGYLGVRGTATEILRHGPTEALWFASKQTILITEQTLLYVGRILMGRSAPNDLRGPIGIAQLSGEVAQLGIISLLELMALLSISLGLINLFPIPLLDGGHLLYYVIEVVRGGPMSKRAQEFGFRIGLLVVLSLMLLATWNDLFVYGLC